MTGGNSKKIDVWIITSSCHQSITAYKSSDLWVVSAVGLKCCQSWLFTMTSWTGMMSQVLHFLLWDWKRCGAYIFKLSLQMIGIQWSRLLLWGQGWHCSQSWINMGLVTEFQMPYHTCGLFSYTVQNLLTFHFFCNN